MIMMLELIIEMQYLLDAFWIQPLRKECFKANLYLRNKNPDIQH